MAYRFDLAESVQSQLVRIAHAEVDAAISGLEQAGDDVVAAVHDARKRCKKLRGLVRLVRPALGERYSHANTTFRDAARRISPIRDAHALLTTFDELCGAHPDLLTADRFDGVRGGLRQRADDATGLRGDDAARVADALTLLRVGRSAIDDWVLDESGFDACAGGLRRTFARGRSALETAIDAPTVGAFHEYRKRTKYTWYHVRLLQATSPTILGSLARGLHDLSDSLGAAHDLAVLSDQLRTDADRYGGEHQVAAAAIVIDGRRADLERRAVSAGARLHAEEPEAFVCRLAGYWSAWHAHGPERRTGDLTALGADRG